MEFEKKAKKRLEEAIKSVIKDSKFEIERNPDQKEEIISFCKDLMELNNNFFQNYIKKDEDIER